MLRIELLIYLLYTINAGISHGLDEGSFLWADRRPENLNNDIKESVVKPGRWTRSVFNWLHSPLINSIQEAFVADSIYENPPPVTKCVKRSAVKNTRHSKLGESFENEFFLWEDNEGNPLEFGLKQIQDVMRRKQPRQHNYRRFNREQTDNLWEEPLVYEYNQDVKDVDVNHLSFHEKYKLNDILKNKLHNVFNHVFPIKRTTKHPSIYYTLSLTTNITSSTNCTDGSCFPRNSSDKEYFRPLKGEFISSPITLSSDEIESEHEKATEMSSKDDFGEQWSSYEPNELKKESHYYTSRDKIGNKYIKLTTRSSLNSKSPSSTATEKLILGNSKGALAPLKPWLEFHEVNSAGEETPYFKDDNLKINDPMKPNDIQKSVSNEVSNHRKLRTVHHKRFLKYRRKNKRKNNKLKYPEGHSYQYELFNANYKPSDK